MVLFHSYAQQKQITILIRKEKIYFFMDIPYEFHVAYFAISNAGMNPHLQLADFSLYVLIVNQLIMFLRKNILLYIVIGY